MSLVNGHGQSTVRITEFPKVPWSWTFQCPERTKVAEAILVLVADYR